MPRGGDGVHGRVGRTSRARWATGSTWTIRTSLTTTKYIETLWWLLKQLFDKGLLYKGYTIQPDSPAAGTGLSTHELNQPGRYRDVKDTTCTARFKVIRDARSEKLFEGAEGDLDLLAWTTTPWNMPSNTALAVGPAIEYVRVKCRIP